MESTRRRHPPLFDALVHRNFRVWLVGFSLATASTGMEIFGLGWLVVEIATANSVPSSLYLGLLAPASLVPAVILGPIAGVVIDRVDRRLLLIVSQGVTGVILVLLGLAASTGMATFGMVFGAAAITTLASVLSIPTRDAIQPRLVGEHDLPSAIGLNSVAYSLSRAVGPLIGGFLIGPFGVGGVLLASGLTQLLGTAVLVLLPSLRVITNDLPTKVLRSLVDGFRYVRSQALLFWLFVAFGASVLFVDVYRALMPALANDVLLIGRLKASWLTVAENLGGIVAGLVFASLRRLGRLPLVTMGALVIFGLLIALFVRQRGMVPLLLIIASLGFLAAFANAAMSLFIQTTTPDHLRGRVNSLSNLIVEIGMTGGTLGMGVLAASIGVDHALTLGGVALIIICLGVASRPTIRRPRMSSG
jgi:MFS family permease